ncbi:MAG: glycerol-3-phosphate 1-O-acyltransferase PlsY [Crocinitomicaceae bacterium]|jgi:glycerol-3-phosphate acyltransferase PlsY|nr:glycerol-3-phosphate 1-O-acyltransferase PlsY [Crocinitomicaceae bacterium]MCF8410962.1 glycerol-3-phosphate 1-O-acyltransferase PlsY [Crocinitomicaceae bacterium]MCF8444511.1 glycerol-3-phosphate 1-O-acyltransferase PlsY [Crocinitomicaceae bacterium]
MDYLLVFFSAIIGYLFGSIPTAVWIGRIYYNLDVRDHGSKNAGATNTFRVLGKKPGIIVLLIDVLKGIIASIFPILFMDLHEMSYAFLISLRLVSSIFSMIGHVLPVFAGFKGGKGVATSLGVLIGLQPFAALLCFSVFLIVFVSFKFVSFGAIMSAVTYPFIVYSVDPNVLFHEMIFTVILSSAVVFTHRKNILRLIKGEESKMNLFKR